MYNYIKKIYSNRRGPRSAIYKQASTINTLMQHGLKSTYIYDTHVDLDLVNLSPLTLWWEQLFLMLIALMGQHRRGPRSTLAEIDGHRRNTVGKPVLPIRKLSLRIRHSACTLEMCSANYHIELPS